MCRIKKTASRLNTQNQFFCGGHFAAANYEPDELPVAPITYARLMTVLLKDL